MNIPSRRRCGLTKYQNAPFIVSIVEHLKRSLSDKAIYALRYIALIIRTKSVKNLQIVIQRRSNNRSLRVIYGHLLSSKTQQKLPKSIRFQNHLTVVINRILEPVLFHHKAFEGKLNRLKKRVRGKTKGVEGIKFFATQSKTEGGLRGLIFS